MSNSYIHRFEEYKKLMHCNGNIVDDIFTEFSFERICNEQVDLTSIVSWYNEQKIKSNMKFEHIPLKSCRGWSIDSESGSVVHESGEFFKIEGLRVTNTSQREVHGGWDQPIISQVGYDGGILGLIRKRISGVPHYLVEAKSEPGNPGIVQISTTVQATFSNLKRAHGGGQTRFAEYFLNPKENNAHVIFERWMSEDGGRLLNKRNKSMIVEVNDVNITDERYRWVSLQELVLLTRTTDAIIAPHIRGILAAL